MASSVSGGIGFAAGSLLTGLLAQCLNSSLGLNVVFLESLAAGLMMSIIVVFLSHASAQDQLLAAPIELASSAGGEHAAGGERQSLELQQQPRLREVLRFVMTPRVAVTLLLVIMLGFGEGIMQTYTYVRLQSLKHGSSTIMGLSAVCMILSEVPFFYFANRIVQRYGIMQHARMMS